MFAFSLLYSFRVANKLKRRSWQGSVQKKSVASVRPVTSKCLEGGAKMCQEFLPSLRDPFFLSQPQELQEPQEEERRRQEEERRREEAQEGSKCLRCDMIDTMFVPLFCSKLGISIIMFQRCEIYLNNLRHCWPLKDPYKTRTLCFCNCFPRNGKVILETCFMSLERSGEQRKN